MDNGNQPATKADLAELRSELKGDITGLRSELKGDMAELRSELKGDMAELRSELKTDMVELREALLEAITDAETRLLKAFFNWAQGTQQHLWDLDRAEISLRERMAGLDKRFMEMTLRPPNMPPEASPPSA
jgi:hypothetical protein